MTGQHKLARSSPTTMHLSPSSMGTILMLCLNTCRPEIAFNGNGIIAKYDPTYSGLELQFDINNEVSWLSKLGPYWSDLPQLEWARAAIEMCSCWVHMCISSNMNGRVSRCSNCLADDGRYNILTCQRKELLQWDGTVHTWKPLLHHTPSRLLAKCQLAWCATIRVSA